MSFGSSIWGAVAALAVLLLFGSSIYFLRFSAVCAADESHIECIRSWLGAVGPIIAMFALLIGFWQFSVNRDSSERQTRAYVGVTGGQIRLVNLSPGAGQGVTVEIKLTNSGKTPAYNFRTWYPRFVVDAIGSAPFSEPPAPILSKQSSILFAGGDVVLLFTAPVSAQDFAEIRSGKKAIFVWGAASYEDTFGVKRTLLFFDRNGDESFIGSGLWPLQPSPPGYQEK